jgi:hypothetical protein
MDDDLKPQTDPNEPDIKTEEAALDEALNPASPPADLPADAAEEPSADAPKSPGPQDVGSGSAEYFKPLENGQYPLGPAPIISKNIPPTPPAPGIGTGMAPQIETLRTYKTDIAEAVKRDNTSVIKVAVAEQKRKIERHEINDSYKQSKRNFFMIAGSIVLILAGIGAGAYAYFTLKLPAKPIAINQPAGYQVITSDYEKEVPTDNQSPSNLMSAVTSEKNQSHPLGSVENIYFTAETAKGNSVLGLKDFVNDTKLNIPLNLLGALGDEFMVGVHSIKGGKLFIILEPTYYEGAYSSLLNWESSIQSDLAPLFQNTARPQSSSFQDKIVQNKDTRILYDES